MEEEYQPPTEDKAESATTDSAYGNSDSSFDIVEGDSDVCTKSCRENTPYCIRPQSILLNGSPPKEEATGLVSVITNKLSTKVAKQFRRNTAYQCGAKFMSNAPPRRDTMSSEPGSKRRTSIQFAPLPPGKPRGSHSFTLGVEARRDILRGIIPIPDSRNPNTVTLAQSVQSANDTADDNSSQASTSRSSASWRDPKVVSILLSCKPFYSMYLFVFLSFLG